MQPVPSSNAWGLLKERGGGDGHLFWIMLLVGVGLNSSGDLGKDVLAASATERGQAIGGTKWVGGGLVLG